MMMMLPAPDHDRCLAYQGTHTGAWYVFSGARFFYAGFNGERALELATLTGRLKGWVK